MSCPPPICSPQPSCDPNNEPLASALQNFIGSFYGTVTKICVDDQVQWVLPCNLDSGSQYVPRQPGEGLACYFLRIYDQLHYEQLHACLNDKIFVNGLCFATWQEAYDYANTLGVPIVMLVGPGVNYGDLVLAANYNSNIFIAGFGRGVSVLGTLHGQNMGTGYSVNLTISNCTITTIDTHTLDATITFDGGPINLTCYGNVGVGSLISSAFNGRYAGTINVNGDIIDIGILDSNGGLGDVSITCTRTDIGSINTHMGNMPPVGRAGNISITGKGTIGNIDCSHDIATNACGDVQIKGFEIGSITNGAGIAGLLHLTDCRVTGQIDKAIASKILCQNVIFNTLAGNQDCIETLYGAGTGQITNSLFIPNGTGSAINGAGNILGFNNLMKNDVGAGINYSGTKMVEATLVTPL